MERKRFDSVWVGEHHVTNDSFFPPLMTLAGIAGSSKRMTMGTAVTISPLHYPLALAEDVAMLSVMSGGRMVLGVGAGYRREEYDAFGVPYDDRREILDEQVLLLRRLWKQEKVSWRSKHFEYRGLSVMPKPSPRRVPIWMGLSGMASASSLARLAEIADAWILDAATPLHMFERKRPIFTGALKKNGKKPEETEFPMIRDLYVTKDRESAERDVGKAMVAKYRAYHRWGFRVIRSIYRSQEDVTFESLAKDLVIVGSPEECIQQVERYARSGVNHLIFRVQVKGLTHSRAASIIDLFSRRVMPHFDVEGR